MVESQSQLLVSVGAGVPDAAPGVLVDTTAVLRVVAADGAPEGSASIGRPETMPAFDAEGCKAGEGTLLDEGGAGVSSAVDSSEGETEEATEEIVTRSEEVTEKSGTGVEAAEVGGIDDAAGEKVAEGEALGEGFGFSAPATAGRRPSLRNNNDCVTSRADNCWPIPSTLSKLPRPHWEPHVDPSAPPAQAAAAPTADLLR